MIEFQRKKKTRRYFNSPILTAVLILVLVFLVFSGRNIFLKKKGVDYQYDLANSESRSVQDEKVFLSEEIKHMSTDRGIEEEIRKKFGVAEEGEMMAVIIEPEDNGVQAVSPDEEKGFWSKFLDLFR